MSLPDTPHPDFAHLDEKGHIRMVNVGKKVITHRTASAKSSVHLGPEIAPLLANGGSVAKGNVLETARLAGIMAAKRTAELIPLCHQLLLTGIDVDLHLDGETLRISSTITCDGKTGAEMEALTAVSVAALTVYDMCKSAGKEMVIGPTRLVEKTGGKSGHWTLYPEEKE